MQSSHGYLSNGGRYDTTGAAAGGHYERRAEDVRYRYDRTREGEGGQYERTMGEEHRMRAETRQGGVQNGTQRLTNGASKYQEYPPDRPFINDDYRRDPSKPIKAFPESNRQGNQTACHV